MGRVGTARNYVDYCVALWDATPGPPANPVPTAFKVVHLSVNFNGVLEALGGKVRRKRVITWVRKLVNCDCPFSFSCITSCTFQFVGRCNCYRHI